MTIQLIGQGLGASGFGVFFFSSDMIKRLASGGRGAMLDSVPLR